MTRQVYNNAMVAHLWANQSQNSARSHNGNFWFSGTVIYSYRTPIAAIHGEHVLVSSERFSMTTSSKHIPEIQRAVDYGQTFRVPFVTDLNNSGRFTEEGMHKANAKYLWDTLQDIAAGLCKFHVTNYRAGSSPQDRIAWLREYARENYFRYKKAFKLRKGTAQAWRDIDAMCDRINAAWERWNDPKRVAQRERNRTKSAERRMITDRRREAERLQLHKEWEARNAGLRAAWLMGERNSYRTPYGLPALLRVRRNPDGDILETSQGASVPLDHAIRAFKLIRAIVERGTPWSTNGTNIRVGHFHVKSVYRLDDTWIIKAGCHRFEYTEMERIARELGVI